MSQVIAAFVFFQALTLKIISLQQFFIFSMEKKIINQQLLNVIGIILGEDN